jgi:hypothetical protein
MKYRKAKFASQLIIVNFLFATNAFSVDYGTYERPFALDSFWNSRPVSPVFSNYVIPNSLYNPTAYTPAYSASCFLADASHTSVTLKVGPGYGGVHDRDAEVLTSEITIPHWPEDVLPASGADAHADVFDVENKIIHSFYRLKKVNGEWTTLLYAWTPLDGRGWGDPAHFYHGGRATGIAACAGMIRKHEVDDGDSMFRHALAISLTDNALSKDYVFPSTSTDNNTGNYTGSIPEGTLLMLPPSFNTASIQTPLIKKIANTLKTYGAYVVDRNYGTPFVIYSEIGANTWTTTNLSYAEFRGLHSALRAVTSVQGWVDGNGVSYQANKNLNILSMRGPWARGYNYLPDSEKCETSCNVLGKFNSYKQVLEFDATEEPIVQANSSGRSVSTIDWAKPKKGIKYQLKAKTTGGAKLRFVIRNPQKNDYVIYDSYNLENDQAVTFTWPLDDYDITVVATSGIEGPSSVAGDLIKLE